MWFSLRFHKAGPVFLLPPEYLEVVRSSNDDVFNQPTAVNEDLQLPFTMDHHQMRTPYQATVLRTDVNRALPSMIPYMLEESNAAIEETFISESASRTDSIQLIAV
ncbi:hypothetical protein H0H93_003518 [Arthromyces matolae]|nr:hypothetical protein H0H93_003518 [Arthromyces matolae]